MNRLEILLIQLMEECCEVSQRASKALRFGLLEVQPNQELNNKERLNLEISDLYGVLQILHNEYKIGGNEEEMNKKITKIEKYLNYSKECGTTLT